MNEPQASMTLQPPPRHATLTKRYTQGILHDQSHGSRLRLAGYLLLEGRRHVRTGASTFVPVPAQCQAPE